MNIEIDLATSPCIRLKRVVHVKDDNEHGDSDGNQRTLNMTQATEQMLGKISGQPKIYLKRIAFEH